MTQEINGFTPVLIQGEGLSDAVIESTFLDDPKLIELRDGYIAAVRKFAKTVGRENLDAARAEFGFDTPNVVNRIMDALRERVSDGFTRDVVRNGDYTNVVSLDETFSGLGIRDVEKFIKGFEEALVRFYAYAELAATTQRNVPIDLASPYSKIGRFEELAFRIRNDIGAELLAEGLATLSRMRELGHTGNAELDAADTPVLFFSQEALDQLFDTLDAIHEGSISLPDGFPSVEDLMERMLQDPEVAPNEIMALIRQGIMGEREQSNHPVFDETPVVGFSTKAPNSPRGQNESFDTQPVAGRHLQLVRE